MALSVQSHLPLITTRITFQYNELPPPPQITPREKYPPNLRRRTRQMLAPYQKRAVRFRTERSESPGDGLPADRFESSAPAEHPVNLHLRSESPLTDISDMSDDSNASDLDERRPLLIPKPPGEAGRANSGGYNLQVKLGWDEKRFKEFNTYINETSEKMLMPDLCFSKQEPKALEKVFQMTAKEFKIENAYEKDWPIREAYKLHLKYTSEYAKKKVVRKATTGIKKAASVLNARNPVASTSSHAKHAINDEDL